MVYEEILIEEGMSKWESKVYLALLELGLTTTGPLVGKAGVPHSKIYVILDSLIKKGFASYIIKGKIKYFRASNPEILLSLAKDRVKRISEFLPNLKNLQKVSENKQKVELYEGMKAITSYFVDLIENMGKGDEWLSFSTGDDEKLEKVQMFFRKIGLLRSEKKFRVMLLKNIKYKEIASKVYPDIQRWLKSITRFSKSIFPSTTTIAGNKVIILNFLSEPETAIVISSKEIYAFYRNFFLNEWKQAKK